MVKTSERYIAMGSLGLGTEREGHVGAVAPSRTSTSAYARVKAAIICVRTLRAWP